MSIPDQIKPVSTREHIFQQELAQQINRSARRGSLFLLLLGVVGVIFTLGAHFLHLPGEFIGPSMVAGAGVFSSIMLYFLARANLLRGIVNYFVMIIFIMIPTTFFFVSHFFYPLGAISYMHGPVVFLYFFIIMLSGFFFDFRLSVLVSVIGALGFMGCYLLGQDLAQSIKIPDDILQTDIVRQEIFALKAIFIALFGPVVGSLSILSRQLISKVRDAEEDRSRIDRLFGQYVSEEVREKIKANRGEEIGEIKHVAILFADLRQFSNYSESQSPQAIVTHLNEYFDAMVEAIVLHGGVVDKFIGDAIMAVFGGVLDLENPCEAALQAAIAMQEKLKELNKTWQAKDRQTLQAGIGLHYGEVLQGNLGSSRRKEFTVIGDAVNAASRLEGATRKLSRSIIVSRAIFDGLDIKTQTRLQSLGRLKVKGKQEELRVYGI